MKVKNLLKILKKVENLNPEAQVFFEEEEYLNLSIDDNNDVQLYETIQDNDLDNFNLYKNI